MAKRNSTGRAGSRSTSAFREGAGKRASGKSDDKPKSFKSSSKSGSGKPFHKAPGENAFDPKKRARPTGIPSQKFDKKNSGNSFKEERGPRRNFSAAPSREGRYKKTDSNDSSAKPAFGKRGNFSSGYKKRSSTDSTNIDKPRKFSDKKSFESGNERSSRPSYKKRSEEKPFPNRRSKSGNEGPPSTGLRRESSYKKSAEPSDNSRKDFGGSDRKEIPFKKRSTGFKKPDERGDSHGKREDITAPAQTGKIRLNKFIANSGVCSRREADELITMGLISVNGKTITELGYKIDPGDEVRHESQVLRAEKPVYILLNKPKGFLTTTSDPQERNTVMHLIANAVKERVYPVGRLDRNTTGLLLLTNDGELADKLMHPSHNAKKIYKVELDRPLTKGDAQLIMEGVNLEEGKALVDDLAILTDDKRTVGIEIHIGWNRVIRRIFESLNYEVVKLDRSVYAGLDKKNLGRGEWRFLTKEEIVRLKHYK